MAVSDLYEHLLTGAAMSNIPLEADVVFVPVHGSRVKVAGAVVRPAIYKLRPAVRRSRT